MHLKPLIIVKSSRDLSFAEANKLIKKFHTTCAAKAASTLNLNHGKHEPTVSEDILDKLSLLVAETQRQADMQPAPVVVATSSKKDVVATPASSSKEQKQKKRKRENKEVESPVETHIPATPSTPSIESSEKKKKKSKKSDK